MVNYVCRTCLYVSANEFSFRKLEKVKPVLEMFIPEVKNYVGKYSLICEQCYYFLKNVEKFKLKCLETQSKLYSMNLETIRVNHDAILRSVANEAPLRNLTNKKPRTATTRSKKGAKRSKQDSSAPVPSTAVPSASNITLASVLNGSELLPSSQKIVDINDCNPSIPSTGSNDLLELLTYNAEKNSQEFRECVIKSTKGKQRAKVQVIMNYNDEVEVNDDEYMTRDDLVAAGIFPRHADKESPNVEQESQNNNDLQMIRVLSSEDEEISPKDNSSGVDAPILSQQRKITNKGENDSSLRETDSVNMEEMPVQIKQECTESENPGFFNKKTLDGFYKCRLCPKRYKTSKYLYNHTRNIHSDHVRLHHCKYCSFFTLWRSSLMGHYSTFHGESFGNSVTKLKCYHCSFECQSKEQLSRHVQERHAYEKFVQCPFCRARFTDNILFAQHVEKEHIGLDMTNSSNFCSRCGVLFLTEEDYANHANMEHGDFVCTTTHPPLATTCDVPVTKIS